MFHITKLTLSDRIYPIECTYVRVEGIILTRQILRVVKFGQYDKEKNRAPLETTKYILILKSYKSYENFSDIVLRLLW